MLRDKKYENELKELNELILETPFITLEEINNIFKNPSIALLDEIEEFLNENSVELISDDSDINILSQSNSNLEIDEKVIESIGKNIKKSSESNKYDIVKTYLYEIGQIPLLSAKEEQMYGTLIQKGNKAEHILAHVKDLSNDYYMRLTNEVEEGLNARKILVSANLRLVVAIAKNYTNRGLSFMDLVQEGNLGLIKAVYRFDPTRGFRFSTYGTWWIRQAITRGLADKARKIRIPVHMVDAIHQMNRKRSELFQQLQRDPTIEELAQALNMPFEKVSSMLTIQQDIQSLDSPIGDDDICLSDLILDDTLLRPSEYTDIEIYKEQIRIMLHSLMPREEQILKLRYGIDDNICRTLDEVAQLMGITRERVRQIEIKAIRRLRHPSRVKILKDR